MAEENKIILDADVKPLKKQLREATQELQVARQKFGEFSDEAVMAAQKVAGIRDSIEDANEAAQLFDPGKRFQALTTAASTAAGGIAAVQGAMALFGSESQDVEKALLKVQSAMALSQGLSQLKDIGKVGDQLKLSFQGLTAGANGFKKALISTGIGALVVAVGLLVAYWDDILELVGGVSSEQKKLNEQTLKNLDAEKSKLDAIDGQTNQLKLQGKTENEILDLKIAQTKEAIKAAEISIANANITKEAQIEAAERNKDILKGIMVFLNLPITALLKTVDAMAMLLQKAGVISEATALSSRGLADKVNDTMAKTLFDPEQVAEEGSKAVTEAENTLASLLEKQAGYELSKIDLQKQAGEKASAEREKQAKAEEEAQAILNDAKNKMEEQQVQDRLAVEKSYQEKFAKLKEAGIEDDGNLAKAKQKELDAIDEKYNKEKAEKEKAFQKELNEILTQTRLDGIRDENEKAREQIILDFEKRKQETLENDKLTSEQRTDLLKALQIQEDQALKNQQKVIDEQNAIKELEALDAKMKESELDLQMQKDLLDQKEALNQQYYESGKLSEEQYTANVRANSEARKELDKQEYELKIAQAQAAANVLGALADLAGKRTAAGKALGIAAALTNTYVGVTEALSAKSVLPSPFDVVAKVANVATILASGLKAVKAITAVQVPGGGGGGGGVSAPSISASAPATTSSVPTIGSSPVTALGAAMQNQPPVRAYVVESEVTGTQKRVADIERRAGF
jgi:hypothetical protein